MTGGSSHTRRPSGTSAAGRHAATHRAAVRDGADVRIAQRPTPRPGPGELLIAPRAAGLCGTDLQMLRGLRDDPAPVIGHEGVATVVAAGAGAPARLAPGTEVVVNPTHPSDDSFLLGHVVDGLLQERVLLPATAVDGGLVLPVRAGLGPRAAALIEPLAVVRYALSALAAGRPRTLLVYGDGTVGHLAVRSAPSLLGAGVRTVHVHHTARGRDWSARQAHAADVLLLSGEDTPETLRAAAGPGPVGAVLATPRSATLDCLSACLRAGLPDLTVDLLGGLPPSASCPLLPDTDLVAVRSAHRAGRPDPVRFTHRTTTEGEPVRLFGHRGVGNGHLLDSVAELERHPQRYEGVVTHTVGLGEAATVMAGLARGGERTLDGERLVKLAVQLPDPPTSPQENR